MRVARRQNGETPGTFDRRVRQVERDPPENRISSISSSAALPPVTVPPPSALDIPRSIAARRPAARAMREAIRLGPVRDGTRRALESEVPPEVERFISAKLEIKLELELPKFWAKLELELQFDLQFWFLITSIPAVAAQHARGSDSPVQHRHAPLQMPSPWCAGLARLGCAPGQRGGALSARRECALTLTGFGVFFSGSPFASRFLSHLVPTVFPVRRDRLEVVSPQGGREGGRGRQDARDSHDSMRT